MHAEVTIVGAGFLGLSLASALAAEGCSSIILEREPAVGRHASGKNAGMFRQLYRNPQLTDWARRSPALWPERIRTTCFVETGSYVIGRSSPGHSSGLFQDRVVPAPPRGEVDAVYTATDGLIDAAKLVPLLAAGLPPKLSRLAFDTKALEARFEDGTWRIRTEQNWIESPRLVVGNGAWVSQLPVTAGGRSLTLSADLLKPFQRSLFVVSGWPPGMMPAEGCGFFWNELDEWYIRRWADNTRLLSICDRVSADPDRDTDSPDRTPELRRTLTAAFPALAGSLTVREHWHCYRTYTPDQLPVWGPDLRQDNLFWLAGFGGFGMSTGFAAAYDLCRLLAGKPVTVSTDVIVERLLATHTCRSH